MSVLTEALPQSVAEALSAAVRRLTAGGVPNAVGEAKELVSKALGGNRKTLDLRRGEAWSSSSESILNLLLLQRLDHVPLAYLLNEWDFLDMTLTVTPDVLIPRPETEELFQWVAGEHRVEGALADVGTGAGGLALAAARQWPRAGSRPLIFRRRPWRWRVGTPGGMGWRNASNFRRADLLEGVNVRSLGVVVANLPYVATGDLADLSPDVLKEPRRALDGGPDGLSVIRRLIPQAYGALRNRAGDFFLRWARANRNRGAGSDPGGIFGRFHRSEILRGLTDS
jgi:release factor glutamine methyltransferase